MIIIIMIIIIIIIIMECVNDRKLTFYQHGR